MRGVFKEATGNGITEYAMVGVLVLLVCIPQVTNIGNFLTGRLSQNTAALAMKAAVTSNASITGDISVVGPLGITVNMNDYQTALNGSNAIVLSSEAIADQIEVGGGSGAIKTLIALLESAARNLEANNGDPGTIADLLGLANEGYALSAEIKYTEDNISGLIGTNGNFNANDILYGENGDGSGGGISNINSRLGSFETKLSSVLTELQNAPTLQSQIQILGLDITLVGQAYASETQKLADRMIALSGGTDGDDYTLASLGNPDMNGNVASTFVKKKSDDIQSRQ